MALSWVRIDREIASDPKIAAMAYELRKEEAAVIGYLVQLFSEMVAHAKTGNLADVPDASIEKWAGWRGKRGVFAPSFRATFTTDGLVTAWQKYNGAAIQKAEIDAERKREWRAAGAGTARAGDADGRARGAGTGRTDGTDGTTSPLPFRARDLPDVLKAAVPEADQQYLCDLLNRVNYRPSWIASFEGALQGIHYKPVDGKQLAQAVREFLGNIKATENPNMRFFEQHVRTIAEGERPRGRRGQAPDKISEGLAALATFSAKGDE